jgi:ferric-dicitrate binding protein FerR (iron transport regulator)
MNKERLEYLFGRYSAGTASREEENEFKQLSLQPIYKEALENLIHALLKTVPGEVMNKDVIEDTLRAIYDATPDNVVSISKSKYWMRIAAAASIIFVLAAGSYFLFFNKTSQAPIAKTTLSNDVVAPQVNRASVTLAGGQKIYLDSAVNGIISKQGNVKLEKLADGQIVYSGLSTAEVKNTIDNPRGSKILALQLGDGTHVWLNAGSSVTYAITFIGNERKVSITGEVYFEVAHDASKPFIVSKGETSITVLGTHFNVNAYDDEDNIKVTLLEGSISVKSGAGSQKSGIVIKPGQQAQVASNNINVLNKVDGDEVMAWKNNLFDFENADVKMILRQFARWYDLNVIYEGELKDRKFFGIVKRSSPLSDVLQILKSNDIHFRIEGNKLYVVSG